MKDSLRLDLRQGVRQLLRNPGFSAVAIVTLGLGIGANTAIFSVVHGVLLRPLDYPRPDGIYTVWENHERRDGPTREWTGRSTFLDWRTLNRSFEHLAAIGGWAPNLTGLDRPEGLVGERVTPGYFPALGVAPVLGRGFLPEEELPGRHLVVVLGNRLWQRRFGGDPAVVGTTITLNGERFTVIGVMPAGFRAPLNSDAEIWSPLDIDPAVSDHGNYYLRAVGRLRAGVSPDAAQADMSRVAREIGEAQPIIFRDVGITLVPLHEFLVGPARTPLLLLLAAVGLVLLIACANIANLLIVRLSARERELALRAAIGAGRGRLLRQLLTETLVLAGAGGALGLALGIWGMDLLRGLAPAATPRIGEVGLDPSVFGYALLAALAAGILIGLLPAGRLIWSSGVADSLRGSAQGATVGSRGRLRGALVVSELALGLTLLAGAGLLVRSLLELGNIDPGIRTENALAARLLFPAARYPERHDLTAVWSSIEDRLQVHPAVEAAGGVSVLPLSGSETDLNFLLEGTDPPLGDEPASDYRAATPGYFSALGIRLVRGRLFEDGDVDAAPRVALVSEEFVRRFSPDRDPIGRRMRIGSVRSEESPWWTIVGIVGSVRDDGLDQPPEPEMYVPLAQSPNRVVWTVLYSSRAPETLTSIVRDEVFAIDAELPVTLTATMDELVRRNLAAPRFTTALLSSFAALALILAAVGIYGVIAYSVTQRTREIGIRMALGADRADVLRLVLREGAVLTTLGLGIGLAASVVLTRMMSTLLFQVSPTDPITLAGVSTLLAGIALTACSVPARRAAAVDPILTLKHE